MLPDSARLRGRRGVEGPCSEKLRRLNSMPGRELDEIGGVLRRDLEKTISHEQVPDDEEGTCSPKLVSLSIQSITLLSVAADGDPHDLVAR